MTYFLREAFQQALRDAMTTHTLRDIADATGISVPTLSRIRSQTGSITPDIETFFAVCAWMDVSPELFTKQTRDRVDMSKVQMRRTLQQLREMIDQAIEESRVSQE